MLQIAAERTCLIRIAEHDTICRAPERECVGNVVRLERANLDARRRRTLALSSGHARLRRHALRAGSTRLALEIVPHLPAVLQNAGELPALGAERVQIGLGHRTGVVEIAGDLAITPLGLHENERRLYVYVGHLWNERPWRRWELVLKRKRRHDDLRQSVRFRSRLQFRCAGDLSHHCACTGR